MWQAFGLAQPSYVQALQFEIHTLREELRVRVQQGTETANGRAAAGAQVVREEFPSLTASLPVRSQEREARSVDLLTYFEPVDFAANSTPAQSQEKSDPANLLDYFEPVDWSTEVKRERGGIETAKRRVKNRTGQQAAKERREEDAVAA